MLSTPTKERNAQEHKHDSNTQETARTSHIQSSPSKYLDRFTFLERTQRKANPTSKIDYKTKTFALLSQITQLKIKEKKDESRISLLENKCKGMEEQITSLMEACGCRTMRQIANLVQAAERNRISHTKAEEMQKNRFECIGQIYRQYNLLHENLHQQMQKQYTAAASKRIQELSRKYQIQESQLNKICEQNKQLKSQLKQLKREFVELLQENSELKENTERLQENLRSSIQKYEQIQAFIQEKMNVYKDTIREYESIIREYENQNSRNPGENDSPQKEANSKHKLKPTDEGASASGNTLTVKQWAADEKQDRDSHRADFSFGRDSDDGDKQKITDITDENAPYFGIPLQSESDRKGERSGEMSRVEMEMSMQCYRASIDGLLQQNRRLKKSFGNLYKLKQGEDLPADLLKEITIMKSIIELNSEGTQ